MLSRCAPMLLLPACCAADARAAVVVMREATHNIILTGVILGQCMPTGNFALGLLLTVVTNLLSIVILPGSLTLIFSSSDLEARLAPRRRSVAVNDDTTGRTRPERTAGAKLGQYWPSHAPSTRKCNERSRAPRPSYSQPVLVSCVRMRIAIALILRPTSTR